MLLDEVDDSYIVLIYPFNVASVLKVIDKFKIRQIKNNMAKETPEIKIDILLLSL